MLAVNFLQRANSKGYFSVALAVLLGAVATDFMATVALVAVIKLQTAASLEKQIFCFAIAAVCVTFNAGLITIALTIS